MSALLALQLDVDSGAACFVDGVLRCAVRECLLTRQPPQAGFPSAAIDAVLDAAGVGVGDVGRVLVVGVARRDPILKVRSVLRSLRSRPAGEGSGVRIRHGVASGGPVDAAALRTRLIAAGLGGARLELVESGRLPLLGADSTLRLPESPLWGLDFTDMAAYRALSNARLPRHKTEDAAGAARSALAAGETVIWARGPTAFQDQPLGPRMRLCASGAGLPCRPGNADYVGPEFAANASLLVAPDGLPALSPVDVVRAWRATPGARLILGDYVV